MEIGFKAGAILGAVAGLLMGFTNFGIGGAIAAGGIGVVLGAMAGAFIIKLVFEILPASLIIIGIICIPVGIFVLIATLWNVGKPY
ncbi:hypothetical protein JIR23_21145 [Bradyrhizobium diazoefficiens]|nr:hypothetical protein [Bradyrhizobium diazoefficiens]QQN62108.1 hypothetical protein JIR23_21145 [Bradyrhizobium diazoefficiens]